MEIEIEIEININIVSIWNKVVSPEILGEKLTKFLSKMDLFRNFGYSFDKREILHTFDFRFSFRIY